MRQVLISRGHEAALGKCSHSDNPVYQDLEIPPPTFRRGTDISCYLPRQSAFPCHV